MHASGAAFAQGLCDDHSPDCSAARRPPPHRRIQLPCGRRRLRLRLQLLEQPLCLPHADVGILGLGDGGVQGGSLVLGAMIRGEGLSELEVSEDAQCPNNPRHPTCFSQSGISDASAAPPPEMATPAPLPPTPSCFLAPPTPLPPGPFPTAAAAGEGGAGSSRGSGWAAAYRRTASATASSLSTASERCERRPFSSLAASTSPAFARIARGRRG